MLEILEAGRCTDSRITNSFFEKAEIRETILVWLCSPQSLQDSTLSRLLSFNIKHILRVF